MCTYIYIYILYKKSRGLKSGLKHVQIEVRPSCRLTIAMASSVSQLVTVFILLSCS